MYSLARLLAHGPAGLYRLDATSRPRPALFRLNGVELFSVRGECVRDKQRFLRAVARAMALPLWFGMNWDALADSLTDFEWEPGYAATLMCSKLDGFARQSPVDFVTALEVLDDTTRYWAQRDVRFLVLIDCDNLSQFARLPTVR
jgi:hypothetical protein